MRYAYVLICALCIVVIITAWLGRKSVKEHLNDGPPKTVVLAKKSTKKLMQEVRDGGMVYMFLGLQKMFSDPDLRLCRTDKPGKILLPPFDMITGMLKKDVDNKLAALNIGESAPEAQLMKQWLTSCDALWARIMEHCPSDGMPSEKALKHRKAILENLRIVFAPRWPKLS